MTDKPIRAFFFVILFQFISLNAEESESDLGDIVSDRFAILNAIKARDYKTVIDLSDVSRYEDSKYSFLWPGERLIIDLLTHTFFFIIKSKRIDSLYSGAYSKMYNPPDDEIYSGFQEVLHRRKYEILKEAQRKSLPVEDLIFIEILMKWFTLSLERDGITQKSVNTDCKSFLAEYPGYKYEKFINKNIIVEPEEFVLSPKIDIFFGTGIPAGNISDKVNYYIDFGIYPTISIKNHSFSLPISFGFFKAKDTITIGDEIIEENKSYYYDNLIINYGYRFTFRKLYITPNIGFGFETYHSIAVSDDPLCCGFDFGVKFDLPFRQKDFFREKYKKRRKLILNLTIGLQTRHFCKNKPKGLNGTKFYSTLGIGCSSHFIR